MLLLTSGIQMNSIMEEFDWSEHIISTLKCSLTSPYGHLYNTDTSLLWTVHLVPEMPKIIHSLTLWYRHLCKADTWFCPFGVHIKEVWLYIQMDPVSLLQTGEDDNLIYSWCTRLVKLLVPWSKCISVETSCIVQCRAECMLVRCKSGWKIWVDGSQSWQLKKADWKLSDFL